MNTLSSLPPPSFADLALRGATPAAPAEARRFDSAPDGELRTLHVSAASQPRALDDIERDFLDALCESRPA